MLLCWAQGAPVFSNVGLCVNEVPKIYRMGSLISSFSYYSSSAVMFRLYDTDGNGLLDSSVSQLRFFSSRSYITCSLFGSIEQLHYSLTIAFMDYCMHHHHAVHFLPPSFSIRQQQLREGNSDNDMSGFIRYFKGRLTGNQGHSEIEWFQSALCIYYH